MASVIDTLFIELGLDAGKFSEQAKEAEKQLDSLEKKIDKAEDAGKKSAESSKKNAEAQKKHTEAQKKAEEQLGKMEKTIGAVAKGFAAFTALLIGSSGLLRLAVDAAEANRELDNMSKNLGIGRKELSAWQGMAEMAGGSASGMAGYLQSLSGNMTSLVMMGDTSVLPYFNALGVSLLDNSGKVRKLDDVMLDLADSMSSMDRTQAYNLGKQMGMDDGTINTLLRGRKEMERMLTLQKELYRSNEQDIENSYKFAEARAYLNQQWDALMLMLGNALLPVAIKLSEVLSGFMQYLMKHENEVKAVFYGMATAIGVALIPVLISAAAAAWAFIAPFLPAILAVTALGAAFALLYDDYATWAAGGKSLFDWGLLINYINSSKVSTKSLSEGFMFLLTGYKSWSDASNALMDWLKFKGFIDDTGISVKSLQTGFKNLASEIADGLMPYLQDIVEIFMKLKNGDFSGAGDALKTAVEHRWNLVKKVVGGVVEHVAGAADVATGHEVGAKGSLTGIKTPKISGNNPQNQKIIIEEANKAGIDPSIMLAMAHIETGGSFNERSKNSSGSASGLFQFVASTRGAYGLNAQTVFDARENSKAAAKMLNQNKTALKKLLGREPTAGELYLAHQQGIGGAKALLGNKGMRAIDAIAKVYNGNTKKAREVVKLNGGKESMTAGEFASLWVKKADALQVSYRNKMGGGSVINQPIGGIAAKNLQANAGRIGAAKQAVSNRQQVTNTRNDVVVNNVNIQTSSTTMQGVGKDMATGINDQLNQLNPGMV